MKWYLSTIKKFSDFQGRARRKEYWMFQLISCIIFFTAMFIDNKLGFVIKNEFIGFFSITFIVFNFLPSFAVTVRRFHDIGKSGWYILICAIPVIGDIFYLIWMCSKGTLGDNKYGKNPKEVDLQIVGSIDPTILNEKQININNDIAHIETEPIIAQQIIPENISAIDKSEEQIQINKLQNKATDEQLNSFFVESKTYLNKIRISIDIEIEKIPDKYKQPKILSMISLTICLFAFYFFNK